jgi:hypothetical protein
MTIALPVERSRFNAGVKEGFLACLLIPTMVNRPETWLADRPEGSGGKEHRDLL